MYYKLNENELSKLKRVSKITLTDYEIKDNLILVDNLMSVIEDLIVEVGNQEEKYKDLKNDLESNYKPISAWEQSGMNERDFL